MRQEQAVQPESVCIVHRQKIMYNSWVGSRLRRRWTKVERPKKERYEPTMLYDLNCLELELLVMNEHFHPRCIEFPLRTSPLAVMAGRAVGRRRRCKRQGLGGSVGVLLDVNQLGGEPPRPKKSARFGV